MKKNLFLLLLAVLLSTFCSMTAQQIVRQKKVDGGGTGPYYAAPTTDAGLSEYVIYRPINMQEAAQAEGRLPILIFANGGCSNTSITHERVLTEIASHGYVIIAVGPMQDDLSDREITQTDGDAILAAMQWIIDKSVEEHNDFCGTVDIAKIGVAGQSCGGAQILSVASNPWIKTYLMFNSGMGDMEMCGASTESLSKVHAPILYIVGDSIDVAYANAMIDYERYADHQPVALANLINGGHMGTFDSPNGGSFAQMALSWLDWQLKGKVQNADIFLRRRLFGFPGWTMQSRGFQEIGSTYPDVHDPVMARGEDGRYYIFATGGGIGVMSSADMKVWRQEPTAFDELLDWAKAEVPGYMGCWAPDISYHNGLWHLYYSCSTFGRNGSAIGLATNKTLDPKSPDFKWEDQGKVIVSRRGQDNWNAIDPNLIVTPKGQPYLVYGSFWDGIQLVRLDKKDFQTPVTKPHTIARRLDHRIDRNKIPFTVENGRDTIEAGENAIEGPFIIRRGQYYYLFVSFDYCCRGENSTYRTVYGRSKNVEGPYIDRQGRKMEFGGGVALVGPSERFFGMGHNGIYEGENDEWYFLCHGYDSYHGAHAKLQLFPMHFDEDGWIVLDK